MKKNMKKFLIGLICSGLLLQNAMPITASIIQETNEIQEMEQEIEQEIEQESHEIDNQKNPIESDDTSLDINELENIETDVIEEDFIEIDEQADNTNFSIVESEDNELAQELIVEERNEVKNTIYGGRISYFRSENGMLFYDGYGYLQGIEIPNKEDVIHKIKFVDASTGKQVQTFNLNHYSSPYVTNDPNHGNGIYNYDWAKFKGYFDVST